MESNPFARFSFALIVLLLLFGIMIVFAIQPGVPQDVFPFLMIGGFLLIAVSMVIFGLWSAKKRRENLQNFAQERGLQYTADDPAFTAQLTEPPRFELFKRGRRRRAYNVLRGQQRGTEFILFDYRFTTGSGKNRHVHYQTAMLLTPRSAPAAPFSLRPQHLFDALATKFGGQDINFPEQPEFSKKYRLQSENEDAIRSTFTPAVLQFFTEQRSLAAEANGEQLLVYYPGQQPNMEKLAELIEKAVQLAGLLGRSEPAFEPYDFGFKG